MQQVAHSPVPRTKKTISPMSRTCRDRWVRRAVSGQVYAAVALALPLSAQGWVPNHLAPDLRDLHAPIAFDTLRGRLVMCSDRTVWEWKSGEWWRRAGPAMPADPWRIEECAYDSVRHRLVVFGGGRGSVIMNETWEYDGVDWVRQSPPQSPPVRVAHAMAFDPGRGRVVLFGGSPDGGSATPALDDLWEWDGTQWQQRVTTGGPSPRFNAAAAYDSVRRRIVIHGGLSNTTQLTDTWEWDGTTWTLRSNAGPASNARQSAAFDARRAVMVVAMQGPGGQVATWEWNGATWADKTTPGWSFFWPRLVYDTVQQRVVLSAQLPYGGFEVRVWDGAAWNTVDEQSSATLLLTSSLVWDSRRNLVVSMTPWTSGVLLFMAEWNGIESQCLHLEWR